MWLRRSHFTRALRLAVGITRNVPRGHRAATSREPPPRRSKEGSASCGWLGHAPPGPKRLQPRGETLGPQTSSGVPQPLRARPPRSNRSSIKGLMALFVVHVAASLGAPRPPRPLPTTGRWRTSGQARGLSVQHGGHKRESFLYLPMKRFAAQWKGALDFRRAPELSDADGLPGASSWSPSDANMI